MNPTTTTPTAPPPSINGISAPGPGPAAASSTPNIVGNIPLRIQGGSDTVVPREDEDAELDKLMSEVGRVLKHEQNKPEKKRRLWLKRKAKGQPRQIQPAVKTAPPADSAPVPLAQPQLNQSPAAQRVAAAAVPKAPKAHAAPVGVVLLTVFVTSALIAVAYYSYK